MLEKQEDKLGVVFFISILALFIVLSWSFNFSVLCGNVNEGFYFVNSQLLLEGSKLYTDIFISRGPLFFLVYAAVLKLFGFGAWSIIAVHILHKVVILLISVVLFLFVKRLINSNLYAALSVLFWFLLQFIPIGEWGSYYEVESTFALEAEFFCVLFSLLSLFFLVQAFSKKHELLNSAISGILATLSMMFKSNGAVLVIAMFCYMFYLLLFDRRTLKDLRKIFLFFFLAFTVCILAALLLVYLHNHDLVSSWYGYASVGSYHHEGYESFLSSLLSFLFKQSSSLSNFFLLLISFFVFIWGIIRNFLVKFKRDLVSLFSPLISIWGIGNVCAVISIGQYASYYYIILWAAVAISFTIFFLDIFKLIQSNFYLKIFITILVATFFLFRLWVACPGYIQILNVNKNMDMNLQLESFQDPVNLSNKNLHRPSGLKFADLINSYLPNKTDKFYILNLSIREDQSFSPFIYIYAKRLCASSIVSDWLFVKNSLNKTLSILVRDLTQRPPQIIIVPRNLYLSPWQLETLSSFLKSFSSFIKDNYHLKDSFSYPSTTGISDVYDVFKRN